MTARGLPVIATCGDCSHNTLPFNAPGYSCDHGIDDNDNAYRAAPRHLPPPDWCPLRTAERSYTRAEVLAFGERVRDVLTERGTNDLPPTWNVVAMRSQELDFAALLDAPERGGGR